MSRALDFDKIKDGIIDKGTELISNIIKDATGGSVTVESIIQGKVKMDANGYIDKVVPLLNSKLESNGLNTLDLPDLNMNFEYTVACGVALPGNVNIDDGSIKGLANFKRTGDAEVKIDAFNNPMILAKARVGIQNANIEYSGKINFYCFGPRIAITGILTDVSLDIEFEVQKSLAVNVHKFVVSSNGDLNLEIQDIGTFDFLSDKISDELKTSAKKVILEYLNKSVKDVIETITSSLPLTI